MTLNAVQYLSSWLDAWRMTNDLITIASWISMWSPAVQLRLRSISAAASNTAPAASPCAGRRRLRASLSPVAAAGGGIKPVTWYRRASADWPQHNAPRYSSADNWTCTNRKTGTSVCSSIAYSLQLWGHDSMFWQFAISVKSKNSELNVSFKQGQTGHWVWSLILFLIFACSASSSCMAIITVYCGAGHALNASTSVVRWMNIITIVIKFLSFLWFSCKDALKYYIINCS